MWRPLLYDIRDIHTAYQRLVNGIESPLARGWETRPGPSESKSLSFTSRTPQFVYLNQSKDWQTARAPFPVTGFAMTVRGEKRREVIARASVGVKVSTRTETMFDPLVTAWELVPFSFVLDWFVNVGEALAAFSPFATGSLAFATLKVTEIETITLSGTSYANDIPSHWSMVSSTPCSSELQIITELSERSLPGITPNLGFNINLDGFKIADLAALWFTRNRTFMRRLLNRR